MVLHLFFVALATGVTNSARCDGMPWTSGCEYGECEPGERFYHNRQKCIDCGDPADVANVRNDVSIKPPPLNTEASWVEYWQTPWNYMNNSGELECKICQGLNPSKQECIPCYNENEVRHREKEGGMDSICKRNRPYNGGAGPCHELCMTCNPVTAPIGDVKLCRDWNCYEDAGPSVKSLQDMLDTDEPVTVMYQGLKRRANGVTVTDGHTVVNLKDSKLVPNADKSQCVCRDGSFWNSSKLVCMTPSQPNKCVTMENDIVLWKTPSGREYIDVYNDFACTTCSSPKVASLDKYDCRHCHDYGDKTMPNADHTACVCNARLSHTVRVNGVKQTNADGSDKKVPMGFYPGEGTNCKPCYIVEPGWDQQGPAPPTGQYIDSENICRYCSATVINSYPDAENNNTCVCPTPSIPGWSWGVYAYKDANRLRCVPCAGNNIIDDEGICRTTCSSSAECSGRTPICSEQAVASKADRVCTACSNDDECSETLSVDSAHCSVDSGKCLECINDNDCSPGHTCTTVLGACTKVANEGVYEVNATFDVCEVVGSMTNCSTIAVDYDRAEAEAIEELCNNFYSPATCTVFSAIESGRRRLADGTGVYELRIEGPKSKIHGIVQHTKNVKDKKKSTGPSTDISALEFEELEVAKNLVVHPATEHAMFVCPDGLVMSSDGVSCVPPSSDTIKTNAELPSMQQVLDDVDGPAAPYTIITAVISGLACLAYLAR